MLKLKKHTVENKPLIYQPLLLLLYAAGKPGNIWTTGEFTPEGWRIDNNQIQFYEVIEWYELPNNNLTNKTLKQQISISDFLRDYDTRIMLGGDADI